MYNMSAFGTIKPGGTLGAQLTFPTIFSEAYAKSSMPIQYAPRGGNAQYTMWAGDDEMADYHAQKARDAHQSCLNGVRDTQMARIRSFTSPHGIPDKPQKVMSQRRIGFMTGALQSDGNTSAYGYDNFVRGYDPTPVVNSISGGVLRTKAGQEYGQMLLNRRKKQLDAMGEVQLAPSVDSLAMNASMLSPTEAFSEAQRLELSQMLDSLAETFATNQTYSADTTAQFLTMIRMVIRFMVSADLSEGNAIKDVVEDMCKSLALYSTDAGNTASIYTTQFLNSKNGGFYESLCRSLLDYVNGMLAGVNLSPQDKLLRSNSLSKSLGFSDILRATTIRSKAKKEGAKNDAERQLLETIARADPTTEEGLRTLRNIKATYDGRQNKELRYDRVESMLDQLLPSETREQAERRREGQAPGDGREWLFRPDARDERASRTGAYYRDTVASEGEAYQRGAVGAPFQPLEDVMGVERASNQPVGDDGSYFEVDVERPSQTSELPEGLEREEGEDKEDYKERLRLAFEDEGATKQNIERLKRVKPSLTWKDIQYIFGMSKSSLQNILTGKREEGAKKKSGRKAKGKK